MAQTSYGESFALGFRGQPLGVGPEQIAGKTAEEAMNFGVAVVQGTEDREVLLPSTGSQRCLGVTLRSNYFRDDGAATDVLATEPVNVLEQGEVYVLVEDAVSAGGAAYFRHTANGGNTELGRFRSDADSSNADLLPNAHFKTSADAGGIAVLKINLPG